MLIHQECQFQLGSHAVRTGQHCAEPVMDHYATTGMCRASFALYNTQAEADALAAEAVRLEAEVLQIVESKIG